MFRMTIDDVFFIKKRGLVATGRVEAGELAVGQPILINGVEGYRADAIEMFRKVVDVAREGDNIGLLIRDLTQDSLQRGDVITTADTGSAAQPYAAGW